MTRKEVVAKTVSGKLKFVGSGGSADEDKAGQGKPSKPDTSTATKKSAYDRLRKLNQKPYNQRYKIHLTRLLNQGMRNNRPQKKWDNHSRME